MILCPSLLLLLLVWLLVSRHELRSINAARSDIRRHPALPDKLLVAYASWEQCDENVTKTVERGANVIVWFSANLEVVASEPRIGGALPDLACVARVANAVHASGYAVTHMLSIGGWNAPLPDLTLSGAAWFAIWDAWNARIAASHNWQGFNGIDWDAEGNDNATRNVFTLHHLRLIGEISVAARRKGYVVSMAPSQSYLDVAETRFDTRVTFAPPWRPHFAYHGRNLYAYVLVFHGTTVLSGGRSVPTFDWVGLQLYEGWSRADYNMGQLGVPVPRYLRELVDGMEKGWDVDFGKLGIRRVAVPRHRLLLGLANGWTEPYPPVQKFLFIRQRDLLLAWRCMPSTPKGFMFWTIAEEGRIVEGTRMFMAKALSNILFSSERNERIHERKPFTCASGDKTVHRKTKRGNRVDTIYQ